MDQLPSSLGFNEHHQRGIRATFGYVDGLLGQVGFILDEAESVSPFRKYTDDTTPVQRKIVRDYVARIREVMRQMLDEAGIALSPPVCGALWAAATQVIFANIAIEEITPKKMEGYGTLPPPAANRLHEMCVEIQNELHKLDAFLSRRSAGEIDARIARLTFSDEAKLLAELERIITAHGLLEFRGALQILLERMESNQFEIGVFGRVSSGKSSLLDYLLETDVLPVGVTPVTAIPTRVRFGEGAEARVEFAESDPRRVELSALAEYVSEQQNPGNAKHVTRIEVKLPAQRLREGIVFVDTPGLGSLAVDGAEETVAYLPRCDLGILLVDGSIGLAAEDLRVIDALYRAGASAMLLLSKADLFSAADREAMLAYVREHVQHEAHAAPPAYAVSVVGPNAALCEAWWQEALRPKIEAHRERAADSRRRKIRNLRESVIAALKGRLRGGEIRSKTGMKTSDAEQAIRDAMRALDVEERGAMDLAQAVSARRGEIIAAAADRIGDQWRRGGDADPRRLFSEAVSQVLGNAIAAFPRRYEELRNQLADALRTAAAETAEPFPVELPAAAGLPIFDPSDVAGRVSLEKPFLFSLLGRRILAHRWRAKMDAQIGGELEGLLDSHGRALRRWYERALGELKLALAGAADLRRARSDPSAVANEDAAGAAPADLATLENWPESEPSERIELPKRGGFD